MNRYPIKPGTPVQLPKRNYVVVPKKQTRTPSVEDQLHRLRSIIKILLVLLLIISLGASYFIYEYFQPEQLSEEPSPGQSWSVVSDET